MKKIILTLALLAVASLAWSAEQAQQTPCDAIVAGASKARQYEVNLAAEQYAAVQQSQRPLTGGGSSSGGALGCLDKYKDISIAGGLGIPDMSQIFDKLMKTASDAVCNTIDSAYSTAARQVSAEVVLPGGIAGAKVRLPTAGSIESTARNPVQISTTNPEVVGKAQSSITDQIRGIFK